MENAQEATKTQPKKSNLKISGLDTFLIIGMIPQLAALYPGIQEEIKSLDESVEKLKELIPNTLQAVEILKAIHQLATT